MIYQCIFNFKSWVCSAYSTAGIGAFKEGFWINKDGQLTTGSDCLYWVPPHHIYYIEKINKDKMN